ncbi:hypothetical protein IFM89_003429 [Coptis chinensis]|uniref:DUF4216 domain-containing protein n=1 Tax=Coptis chinensis TaxID=261450 RepID=A0A835GVY9_9MAGN|nr:hypothetical protein IFM89_003429 [Coptis chinensis]
MEEAMMYCMEYIHDGNLGSHKNGRRVIMNEDIESAHPMDKKEKQYVLPNIEYQQVRKWVLTHSLENAEREESRTSFRASAKDRNLVNDEVTYYGVVKRILELDYVEFKQTVFYCDWVRIEDKTNGCTVDPDTNLVFVNLGRFMRNTSEVDEPFILASEAKQVFYCWDLSRDNWHVVLDAPKRLSQEIDAYEDPLVFEARTSANYSSSTTLIEGVLEVAEDWI